MTRITDEDLDAIEARYAAAACEVGDSDAWRSAEDVPRLVAEVRRLDNEVENLRIARTIGPRVAVVNAAVEREALVARVQDVLAGIDEAPPMYAQTPELLAATLYGVHLAAGGNGATWIAAMRACGLMRGNTYLPVTTWEDAKRLAQHLHETAPRWVGTR